MPWRSGGPWLVMRYPAASRLPRTVGPSQPGPQHVGAVEVQGRMGGHPLRLVDHDDVPILEQARQARRARPRLDDRRLGHEDLHHGVLLSAVGLGGEAAVDPHPARFDDFRARRPGHPGHARKDGVHPLPGEPFGHRVVAPLSHPRRLRPPAHRSRRPGCGRGRHPTATRCGSRRLPRSGRLRPARRSRIGRFAGCRRVGSRFVYRRCLRFDRYVRLCIRAFRGFRSLRLRYGNRFGRHRNCRNAFGGRGLFVYGWRRGFRKAFYDMHCRHRRCRRMGNTRCCRCASYAPHG